MAGVGVGPLQKRIWQPSSFKTAAAARANSSEKNRVSYPTKSVGFLCRPRTCPAIAAAAMRTRSNVKSSAMIPRQPEVPKCMVSLAIGYILYLGLQFKYQGKAAMRSGESRNQENRFE